MSATFSNRAFALFWDVLPEFVGWLSKRFPDCTATSDTVLLLTNVVANDEKKRKDVVRRWHAGLVEPLSKKVRYAKAIERFLDAEEAPAPRQAIVYHAFLWRDVEGVRTSCTSEMLDTLDVYTKAAQLEGTDAETFWRYVDELNRTAFDALDQKPPLNPSRSELAKYVKPRKAAATAGGQMQRALRSALNDLHAGRLDAGDLSDDEVTTSWRTRWVDAMPSLREPIAQRDAATLVPQLRKHFPEVRWSDEDMRWEVLDRVVALAVVDGSVPSGAMSHIEDYAAKLADDIASGRRDIASLDLSTIGTEIMGNLNPDEMSAIASSLPNLLPAIGALQKDGGQAMLK